MSPRAVSAITAILVFGSLVSAAPGVEATAPTGPRNANVAVEDPASGPHAAEDTRHAKQAKVLAPAVTAPVARQNWDLPPLPAGAKYPSRGAAPAAATTAAGPYLQREVLGFAPYWNLSQNANWNYHLLSTIAYFGLTVEADGSFNTTVAGWNQWNSQDLVNTVNNSHLAGDRAVVVIKQFNTATINGLVTNPTSTQTAITNTINAIQSKSLDGVNVDFEGTNDSNQYPNLQTGVTNFMAQLSQQVHAKWPNAEVTIDTYSGSASWDGGIFKIGDLAPVVDGMFVMAYDMAFDDTPGHAGANAPMSHYLYNDTLSVSQYLSKAPASKILLGVPYYGYKWSTSSNQPNATVTSGATADTYADIVAELACGEPSFGGGWDSYAQSPWVSWWSPASGDPCGANLNTWRELYYDNAQSLGYKYDLVNSNNLRGAGMWALGYDGTSPDLWNEIALKLSTVTPWDSVSGWASTGPSVNGWTGWEDIFVGGLDGSLWRNSWNGTAWSGWQGVGGRVSSDPASVSWGANRVDVFVRGADGALWHRAWNGAWGSWESLGGQIVGRPAVASWGANRLDVFVEGPDARLYHKAWNGYAWGVWEGLGGSLGSAPAAGSWGPNHIDVFVRGGDGHMWQKTWTGTAWSAWQPVGGIINSDPTVASCASGHLDLFSLGGDGALWRNGWNGTAWTGWQSQGGQWTSSPAAACRIGGSTVDVFERAFDHAVWHTNVSAT